MREQRLLETAVGVIDRSNRPVLVVSGPDRLPWLHSICSQHVSNLSDGQSTEALVLSPHGHVEQHWQLTERNGMVWLDVEPGMADDALGYLQKMRFLKRVEPSDVSDEWAVVGLVGPAARCRPACRRTYPPATVRSTCQVTASPAGHRGATSTSWSRGNGWPTKSPVWSPPVRRPPDCGPTRRSGSRLAGHGCGSRPTIGRSRTRWAGSARRYISTRAAIGARRRWRACRIWAGPRVGSCSCTWRASPMCCRTWVHRSSTGAGQLGFWERPCSTMSLGPWPWP